MKLKKFFAASAAAVLCLGLMGCNAPKKSEAQTDDKQNLKQVSVVLDWYPNAVHSFIYDAIEKGYYKDEGLKVNILFPSNANDAISLTSAGKAQLGIYYPHDVIQAYANQNVPVKILGSVVQKPLNIILSLKDKNIDSPKDFAGKTIGYAGTSLSEAMINSMLKSQNMSMDDTKMIDVGFDLMSSMTTDKVDATIGCMLNHEVPQMQKEGFDVNYFMVDKYSIPAYPELVFVTNDKTLKNDKETLAKFMRASKKGFEDMKNNPKETLEILLNNQNKENFPLTESVEQKSMEILLPVMQTEENEFLTTNRKDIENTIKWMRDEKIIDKDVNVDDVVVDILN